MYEPDSEPSRIPDPPGYQGWSEQAAEDSPETAGYPTPPIPAPPLPMPPAPAAQPAIPERIGSASYDDAPAGSRSPLKALLGAGLVVLLLVAIGLGWAYSVASVRPGSPFYSPERAVRHSIDLLNQAVDDRDFDEFSRYCDVQGVSAGLATASMQDEASESMYALQRQFAGSSAAKKAWNDDWQARREYMAYALEQAVRTGKLPGAQGLMAPRYYDCFCGDVLSVTFSEDGATARVRAVAAGNMGSEAEGEFDVQHVGDGVWRVYSFGAVEETQ